MWILSKYDPEKKKWDVIEESMLLTEQVLAKVLTLRGTVRLENVYNSLDHALTVPTLTQKQLDYRKRDRNV